MSESIREVSSKLEIEGVIHYCVTNMPGTLARTSTFALTNATFPYALALAEKGYRQAMKEDPALRAGLNICLGTVTHPEVAKALGKEFTPAENFC